MSNMISNSSGVNAYAMTWPLAPEPHEEEISNTSITVSITLKEKHRDIASLKIKVCICIYNIMEFLITYLGMNLLYCVAGKLK